MSYQKFLDEKYADDKWLDKRLRRVHSAHAVRSDNIDKIALGKQSGMSPVVARHLHRKSRNKEQRQEIHAYLTHNQKPGWFKKKRSVSQDVVDKEFGSVGKESGLRVVDNGVGRLHHQLSDTPSRTPVGWHGKRVYQSSDGGTYDSFTGGNKIGWKKPELQVEGNDTNCFSCDKKGVSMSYVGYVLESYLREDSSRYVDEPAVKGRVKFVQDTLRVNKSKPHLRPQILAGGKAVMKDNLKSKRVWNSAARPVPSE